MSGELSELSNHWSTLLMAVILGYGLGSIPFGLILTRLGGGGDLRKIGSGNIGATNVLRTGHKGLAALTLLGDALKATLAVFIASRWGHNAAMLAGLAAFVGHCYPVWLRFRGGKGIATYLGVLLGLSWPLFFVAGLIWLAMAAVFRYSSLSALTMTALIPLILLALGRPAMAGLFAVMAVIAWLRHRENLERLFQGTESRIGNK